MQIKPLTPYQKPWFGVVINNELVQFMSVALFQSWIFQNVSLQDKQVNDLSIELLIRLGQEENSTRCRPSVKLEFIPSLSCSKFAVAEDFLRCLTQESRNELEEYHLPPEFLQCNGGPNMWDGFMLLKNKIVRFLKNIRQLTPTYWVG